MTHASSLGIAGMLVLGVACSGNDGGSGQTGSTGASTSGGGTTVASTAGTSSAGSNGSSLSTTTGGASGGTTGNATSTGSGSTTAASSSTGGAPTAQQLLGLVGQCNEVSNGEYQTDDDPSSPANIPICGLVGAVFWTADMDVDCDGKTTTQCNSGTDPAYQNQTSATDSQGAPLDAAALPYVVVPLPSSRFDYQAAGIELGTAVAVIYQGQLAYGVFGDEGPDNIIGEASYAMASLLGVDPDPATGGTDGPVTYIVFVGPDAVVDPIEDHDAVTAKGETLAAQLLMNN